MLEETEEESLRCNSNTTTIVSWLPDGLHFKVHSAKAFMAVVVPRYFKQKSYKSFQRQLHIYGFTRVLKGSSRGAYFHPKFIKGNRKQTHEIDRIKGPQGKKRAHPFSSQSQEDTKGSQHQDTSIWLTGAGIAFSDLNPNSIDTQALGHLQTDLTQGTSGLSSSLMACADEISSIFYENSGKSCREPSYKQQHPRQEEAILSSLSSNVGSWSAHAALPMNPLASSSSLATPPPAAISGAAAANLNLTTELMNFSSGMNFPMLDHLQTNSSTNDRQPMAIAPSNDNSLDEELFSVTGQWEEGHCIL